MLIFYPIHVHNLSHVIVCVSCCNTDEIFSYHSKSDFCFACNLTIQSGDISEYSDLQSPKYVSIDYKEGKTTLQRCEKTANSGSVNTNGKEQIQLFLGLIRTPYRFCEYLKPIYHQWLNKTSLLKSMENLIWLPALAASSLMSSTASLNAELWKNNVKKHTEQD